MIFSLIVDRYGISALAEVTDKELFIVSLIEPERGDLTRFHYVLQKLFISVNPGFIFDIRHKNNIARHKITS